MNGKKLTHKKGSLFLALMVVVAAGGMLAMQFIPSKTIVTTREKAIELKMNLGIIRQAFDMEHMMNPSYSPDLSSPTSIKQELQHLVDSNLLRKADIKDPTISNYLWNINANYYWQSRDNIPFNTSFEKLNSDDSVASWVLITNTKAEASDLYLDSSEVDNYPNQNKLGKILRTSGKSLKITYP